MMGLGNEMRVGVIWATPRQKHLEATGEPLHIPSHLPRRLQRPRIEMEEQDESLPIPE